MKDVSIIICGIAKDLYDSAEFDVDSTGHLNSILVMDYNDYTENYRNCSEQDYNEAKNLLEELTKGVKYYDGKLELSDNHTVWNIDFSDISEELNDEDYGMLYDDAMRGLEEDIGVEVYGLGRSGRHICVDDTFTNLYRLDFYKEKQVEWEKWLISAVEEELKATDSVITEDVHFGETIVKCPDCGSYITYTKSDVDKDFDGEYITCPNCKSSFMLDRDNPTGEGREVDKISEYLYRNQLYADVNVEGDTAIVHIEWGDWKHDHLRADSLMKKFGYEFQGEEVTDDCGTDCYSATRYYKKSNNVVTESSTKQVNNLKIVYSKLYNKYQVITPDGRVLEEFEKEQDAIDWAKDTNDFVSKKTEAEDLNQVKADIEDAIKDTESTEQEIDQVKGSLDVLKTDEESAIEGYEDFKKETDKVVDKGLADAVNDQMQEIVDDEKEHIEKLDAVKTALGESKVNVDMLQKGQKAVEKKLKSIDKNLTMDDIDIKTDDDGSMHISNRKDNKELCVITQDELAKLLKENNKVKTEDITNSSDLEQLANDIVNWYSNDMGTWFDEIQGNEEDVYNDTLSVLESRDIATIKSIIEDMEEDGSDDVMVLVDKLKELLPKDTLQEDLAPTIKESLNTGVLPIVNVDMYSIMSSGYLDDLDIPDDGMASLDEIVQDIAPKYIKETVQEILPSVEIYVTGVYHPKQYNYSGDELEFELVANGNEYNERKEKAVADASFEQFLKDNYSSRSGFVSSMPNSLNEFNQAPEWKQLVQVIMFALKGVDLEKVNDAYLEEFLEKVIEEFPHIESDLEESKKTEDVTPEAQKVSFYTFRVAEEMYNSEHEDTWDSLDDDEQAEYYNNHYPTIFKLAKQRAESESKKIETKELLNEDAVKEWWVGDPCYVLSDDIYDDIWGKKYDYKDGLIDCGNGLSFQVHGTAYGDGGYEGSNGFIYGVDAGVLAIVPMELAVKEDGLKLGTIHKSATAELEYEDGVFHMIFDNETIDIDTDPTDDDLGLSESKLLKDKGVNE